jgi:hypothetical protein
MLHDVRSSIEVVEVVEVEVPFTFPPPSLAGMVDVRRGVRLAAAP